MCAWFLKVKVCLVNVHKRPHPQIIVLSRRPVELSRTQCLLHHSQCRRQDCQRPACPWIPTRTGGQDPGDGDDDVDEMLKWQWQWQKQCPLTLNNRILNIEHLVAGLDSVSNRLESNTSSRQFENPHDTGNAENLMDIDIKKDYIRKSKLILVISEFSVQHLKPPFFLQFWSHFQSQSPF